MKRNVFYIFIICSFLTGCFIVDNLIDSFRRLNASLEKSNGKLTGDNQAELYRFYKYKKSNTTIIAKADSLHFAVDDAVDLIDILKKLIVNQDTTGENIYIAAAVINYGQNQKLLREKVIRVYNYSHGVFSYLGKPEPDTTIRSLTMMKRDTAWARHYFGEGVPSISGLTALSKFENDCLIAEQQSLLVLKSKLIMN